MSPEYELLARAAVPAIDDESKPPSGVDWPEVLRLAEWHRVTPLVYHYARRCPWLEVPPSVLARLRESYTSTAAVNLYLRREIDRITTALHEAGVAVMLLKGMALVEDVYRELGLRPMLDVDILVPADAYERAGKVLTETGYRGYHGFTPQRDGRSRGPFVKPDGTTGIDLHRDLADDVPLLDTQLLWNRARPSSRGPYLLPHPDDMLLHLAVHFITHRGFSSQTALGQLADMAWVAAGGIEWDQLTEFARTAGVQGRLFVALSAVDAVLGAPVPASALAALRTTTADDEMTQRFIQHRILDTQPWHHPTYFRRRSPFEFSASGRHFGRLLPSRQILMDRYGGPEGPELSYARLYARRIRRAVTPMLRHGVLAEEHLHRWVEGLDRAESAG